MADQQEALERLRELYREKNEHLEKFLEPVEPYEFYREIFPEGSFERKGHFEDRKGNGIAVTVPKGEVDKATGIALQIEGDGKASGCLCLRVDGYGYFGKASTPRLPSETGSGRRKGTSANCPKFAGTC